MSLTHIATSATALLATSKGDPTWFDNPALTREFWPAVGDTILIVSLTTVFTVLLGLPLALLLVQTGRNGLSPKPVINNGVGALVNVVRAFPFIIGLFILMPVTRLLMGTTIGWKGIVFPIIVMAVPYFARMAASDIHQVDRGKIEAAQMMGASRRQIRWGVQIREALPALINSITVLAIALVGYAAMAGTVGGGGLGQMAYNYGYLRWQDDVLICTVVAIIIIVQLIQMLGDMASRLVDHR